MRLALDAGILQFNIEGEPELEVLNEVAARMNRRAPITIRVNPDIDARTHAKIATGTAETKFGIPGRARACRLCARSRTSHLEIAGVDIHIGSQITELGPFEAGFAGIVDLIASLRAEGHPIRRADFGGGLGVPYAGPTKRRPNRKPTARSCRG